MTRQIAVRLPDDIVEFIDGQVQMGQAASRAVVVARALERERRRYLALRDAAILAQGADNPDLDSLAHFGSGIPMPELD